MVAFQWQACQATYPTCDIYGSLGSVDPHDSRLIQAWMVQPERNWGLRYTARL